jgi:hypothetical protein
MKPVMRLGALSIVVLVCGGACQSAPRNSPEAAYRSFVDALQRHNTKKAWAALSASTQRTVRERSKAIAQASRGVVRDEPELLLFQGSAPPDLIDVRTVRADAHLAVLAVESAEGTTQVQLINDSGRWVVDLSESLEGR